MTFGPLWKKCLCGNFMHINHLGVFCDDCITKMVEDWNEYARMHQGKSLEALHDAIWHESRRREGLE